MSLPNSFIKGCAGKVRHKTYLGAEYSRNDNKQSRQASIYKCKHCKYYHIGTRSGSKVHFKTKPEKVDEQHKRKLKRFKY